MQWERVGRLGEKRVVLYMYYARAVFSSQSARLSHEYITFAPNFLVLFPSFK
jgi:hypothetical protein